VSCKISWDDISFPPVNLWVVTDVSYFYSKENYSKENKMGRMKEMSMDLNALEAYLQSIVDTIPEDEEQCGCEQCPSDCSQELSAWEQQEGGEHYTEMPIQPFEYSMANGLDPMQHTIIKYVTRFRNKNGIADLRKARHTLDMLIEWEEANED